MYHIIVLHAYKKNVVYTSRHRSTGPPAGDKILSAKHHHLVVPVVFDNNLPSGPGPSASPLKSYRSIIKILYHIIKLV